MNYAGPTSCTRTVCSLPSFQQLQGMFLTRILSISASLRYPALLCTQLLVTFCAPDVVGMSLLGGRSVAQSRRGHSGIFLGALPALLRSRTVWGLRAQDAGGGLDQPEQAGLAPGNAYWVSPLLLAASDTCCWCSIQESKVW